MRQIAKLNNQELLKKVKDLAGQDRHLQIELLHHLREVEVRRLHLDLGFGSLFEYVVKDLGYSESSAYRRIQAMRLLKDVPEIETKIAEGTLTLSAAAQVQTFLKAESKVGQLMRTTEEKLELISSVENKSSRDVEKQLFSLQAASQIPQEKIRQITDTHAELRLVLSDELRAKLDRLRLLLSHVNPNMNYLELYQYLCDKALKQLDPTLKSQACQSKPLVHNVVQSENSVQVRYITADLKAKIWQRDEGKCTYVDHKSKRRCESQFQLEIDHIRPFSLGGDNSEENLRLLCSHHNLHRARKTFGQIAGLGSQ